ncbi:U32 family peptidase [candidate division KSB1 bacterium]|nr:U32 family peptidase [candidate division KSB1 bacterium]
MATNVLKKPELLAPVGDLAMLQAALESGCDAVYFGIRGFNMRVRAQNFSLRDLPTIVARCHARKVSAYLTLNTLVFENELNPVRQILQQAQNVGIDAIIASDLGVVQLARAAGLEVHLSTQASVANSAAIQSYQSLGVTRFILARELTLAQIQTIKSKTTAEIETFVHGALCVSESGRCLISQFVYGKAANRGECWQPCRREYRVIDQETEQELILGNHYILSPKDLCTLPFIEQLIAARIDAFKIEGRARSPEYVKVVVAAYREAIDRYFTHQLTPEVKTQLQQQVKTVFHREFSSGFYFGQPENEWSTQAGSQATLRKEFLGVVQNHYKKAQAADIWLKAMDLSLGDQLLIIGPTTGVVELTVTSIHNVRRESVARAAKGELVGLPVPALVRRQDQVYKIIAR